MAHSKAVKRIGRYLLETKDKGIIMSANDKDMECFVDADFAGNWRKEDAADDPLTARSRTGYLVTVAGCPTLWHSKLQTETVLSTTEAEYVALSESMRDVLPLMELLEELRKKGFAEASAKPTVKCTAFEDNEGAINLAKTPKLRPRTKHINNKYHHFREQVQLGKVDVQHIATKQQLADLLTKPLPELQFIYLRDLIMGKE